MRQLEQPKYVTKVIAENGYNNDIIKALNNSFTEAARQAKNIKFSGSTQLEKGRAIYNFLRNSITYKKDPEGKQYIQLPARLIHGTKAGDCKSLALSAAAFMAANGFKDIRLRYAAYSDTDTTPSHVYTVGKDENGADIIIDAVYRQYNKEVPYTQKKDYPMKIEVLSGLRDNIKRGTSKTITIEELAARSAGSPFRYNAIRNEIARKNGKPHPIKYTPAQLKRYALQLQARINSNKVSPVFKNIFRKELQALNNNTFNGAIIQEAAYINGLQEDIGRISLRKIGKKLKKISPKKIWQAVKAVGLIVPRKAGLALMALNFRGMATRASKVPAPELKNMWEKFGGKFSVFEKAIRNGKGKKPLFGASKKRIKVIKGIGAVVVEDSQDIGAAPAVAAFIAAAGPFLLALSKLFKKHGVEEVPEGGAFAEENQDFAEVAGSVQDQAPQLLSYLNQAKDIAEATGIIPSKKNTPIEDEAERGLQTDEEAATGDKASFSPSPILLLAGAGALYLITKK